MNTLKFRAYSKSTGHYFNDIQETDNMHDWFDDPDMIIEQDTGRKDKKGRRIHEGDIVRTKSGDRAKDFEAGAIEMQQQMYLIMNTAHYRNPGLCHSELLGYYCENELEIIGDIHHNKELLGE